jgi:dipeptidase E
MWFGYAAATRSCSVVRWPTTASTIRWWPVSGDDHALYAGYSAGPAVLTPSLRGIELVDDPTAVEEPIWEGLSLLDRPFVPHVDSIGHPETADCDGLRVRLRQIQTPHWALRDGDVLVVHAGRSQVFGRTSNTPT